MIVAGTNNKSRAMRDAIKKSADALGDIDLAERCDQLGIDQPNSSGTLTVNMLGRQIEFTLPTFESNAHLTDQLLLLHYLQAGKVIAGVSNETSKLSTNDPANRWESFRQFPGGQFYWAPFRSRTSDKLVSEIGNNLDLLADRLSRYDWSCEAVGDFGAKIKVLPNVELLLVYRTGDDEFGCDADILFDSNLKYVYCAEDAAALAGRMCVGLCEVKCVPCNACKLCDR